jgi:hypothetical protein
MKVVINSCFGGFGLSAKAIKLWATRKGRKCFFFVNPSVPKLDIHKYQSVTIGEAEKAFMWHAFDIPNPDEVLECYGENWHNLSDKEKQNQNALYSQHSLYHNNIKRTDPDLIAVVELLGKAANGKHAELSVVEIPDDVEWEIEEYDGNEHIAEVHRTWS